MAASALLLLALLPFVTASLVRLADPPINELPLLPIHTAAAKPLVFPPESTSLASRRRPVRGGETAPFDGPPRSLSPPRRIVPLGQHPQYQRPRGDYESVQGADARQPPPPHFDPPPPSRYDRSPPPIYPQGHSYGSPQMRYGPDSSRNPHPGPQGYRPEPKQTYAPDSSEYEAPAEYKRQGPRENRYRTDYQEPRYPDDQPKYNPNPSSDGPYPPPSRGPPNEVPNYPPPFEQRPPYKSQEKLMSPYGKEDEGPEEKGRRPPGRPHTYGEQSPLLYNRPYPHNRPPPQNRPHPYNRPPSNYHPQPRPNYRPDPRDAYRPPEYHGPQHGGPPNLRPATPYSGSRPDTYHPNPVHSMPIEEAIVNATPRPEEEEASLAQKQGIYHPHFGFPFFVDGEDYYYKIPKNMLDRFLKANF